MSIIDLSGREEGSSSSISIPNDDFVGVANIGHQVCIIYRNKGSAKPQIHLFPTETQGNYSQKQQDAFVAAMRNPVEKIDVLLGHLGTIDLFNFVKQKMIDGGFNQSHECLRLWDILHERNFTDQERDEFLKIDQSEEKSGYREFISIFNRLSTPGLKNLMRSIYLDRKRQEENNSSKRFADFNNQIKGILGNFTPGKISVFTGSNFGEPEIYARHLIKVMGDIHPSLGSKTHHVISPDGITTLRKNQEWTPISE